MATKRETRRETDRVKAKSLNMRCDRPPINIMGNKAMRVVMVPVVTLDETSFIARVVA